MSDLDHQSIRDAMISRFGKERYGAFVAAINGRCQIKQRLFFWQEQMWAEVRHSLGLNVVDFEFIADIFRTCHVHGLELAEDRVKTSGGTFRVSGEFVEAQADLFPFARDVVYLSCEDSEGGREKVLFCPACREAKNSWVIEHGI